MIMATTDLKKLVSNFPKLPGVYLMKDDGGEVMYVGKAKELQSRVRSYLTGGDGRVQIEFLMERVAHIETIICASEEQAFILERDLIAKFKPRYNIRLKDDKAYLSVRIDENARWPRLELVRRVHNDGATYYGPYTYSYELREVLEVIRNVVPLRSCSDTVLYNRQRPCLEYQIRRCAGPCCLPVNSDEYRRWVVQAKQILEGRTPATIKSLNDSMQEASDDLRFEEAAAIRDRIEVLERFTKGHKMAVNLGDSRDAIGFFREAQRATVSILHVRGGRVSDNSSFAFSNVIDTDEELIESIILQFYSSGRETPDEILLPTDLASREEIENFISKNLDAKVSLVVPQKGVKERLVGLATVNARQQFVSKFDEETRYTEAVAKLAALLNLHQVPRRIECVDISNFQGSDIVGAIVVFFDGKPLKSEYKKYKISQQGKPDDFASMHEVVTRRLARAMETGEFPDLLLIDGGPGQLSSACRARDELKLEVDIASIAKIRENSEGVKMPERLFVEGSDDPIPLLPSDEVTLLVSRIRDEVHRFVIGFHRNTRSKRVFKSVLDDIPGVGPERRGRLLREFGSVDKIKNADVEKIAKVGRMPKPLAEKILAFLNKTATS